MPRPAPTNHEKILNHDDFIVSKTDTKGKILYGNKIFIQISGYSESELLGKPQSILRHSDMPKCIFKLLWERIQNKQEIFAIIKNLCKDGSYYWVSANVTVTLNQNGTIRDYHSVRRKPSSEAMEIIPPLYKRLLDAEKSSGMQGSYELLQKILKEKGVDYDSFVLNIQ